MPNEQWYMKQAYGEKYWEADDFTDFLRWYAKQETNEGVDMEYIIDNIIDIVEKPYKSFIRKEYYRYLREKYDES
tara:strand:- start:344 stop:568 length:225 start_codon:yes stop_codon:yes gene_type:complete